MLGESWNGHEAAGLRLYPPRKKGTYDDEHAVRLARNVDDRIVLTVRKKDVQNFFKRVRSYIKYHKIDDPRCQKDFKVIWCSEYGDKRQRPHFHFIAFGLDFAVVPIGTLSK